MLARTALGKTIRKPVTVMTLGVRPRRWRARATGCSRYLDRTLLARSRILSTMGFLDSSLIIVYDPLRHSLPGILVNIGPSTRAHSCSEIGVPY